MSDQPGLMVYVEGREYDATSLTLDEAEEIEDACGGVALEHLDIGRSMVLKAIVYTLLKRDDPDVTMDTIGKIRRASLFESPVGNGAQPIDDAS